MVSQPDRPTSDRLPCASPSVGAAGSAAPSRVASPARSWRLRGSGESCPFGALPNPSRAWSGAVGPAPRGSPAQGLQLDHRVPALRAPDRVSPAAPAAEVSTLRHGDGPTPGPRGNARESDVRGVDALPTALQRHSRRANGPRRDNSRAWAAHARAGDADRAGHADDTPPFGWSRG